MLPDGPFLGNTRAPKTIGDQYITLVLKQQLVRHRMPYFLHEGFRYFRPLTLGPDLEYAAILQKPARLTSTASLARSHFQPEVRDCIIQKESYGDRTRTWLAKMH